MATVKGYVEKIKYRNQDNGYTVLSVSGAEDGEEYILVGTFSYITEGELIEAEGRMTEHPVYGEQLTVETYELKAPEDTVSMERYLGSGAIKGVGAALAARIVKKFKADTFRIVSKMAVNGVVFSDGMESDAIEFNAGSEIEIGIADKKGNLVV